MVNANEKNPIEGEILKENKLKINLLPLKSYILGGLAGILIGGFIVFNLFSFGLLKTSSFKNINSLKTSGLNTADSSNSELAAAQAFLKFKQIKAEIIPSGVPNIYGQELNISFDKAQEAINKVAPFDLTYGTNKINLTSEEMKRYIAIGSQTACKYCCGATTLVFENGEAACGCEHSQMMRGLAAYLIKNHPEMSNEQILNELNAWRNVFFPKQTLTEKLAELEKAGEPGIKELLNEFPDFLPQMVGGC